MAKRQEIPDPIAMGRQQIQQADVLGDVLGSSRRTAEATMIRSQLRYDYSLIPVEQRDTVQDAAVEIVRNGRQAQDSLIQVGKQLIAVKDMLEHGQFEDWCSTEFQMSPRTVQNMMNVARTFEGKSEKFALLGDSTLYMLAAPSTPEAAREQVIAEAEATGSKPSVARVKEVIAQHKPTPKTANVVPSEATGSRQRGAQLATCRICHRPLSDPASAIAGVGPCCAGKQTTAAGSGTADDDEDEQPTSPRIWTGITVHTWDGYSDWTDDDEAEYQALHEAWKLPGNQVNSLMEMDKITRWRVAGRLATEVFDNRAHSLQDKARRLRLKIERPAPPPPPPPYSWGSVPGSAASDSDDDDDDDDLTLTLDTVDEDDDALDILAPDRHEVSSATQQRNQRIDHVTRALTTALDSVSEFEALTGAYTLTPALRRAIEPMLKALEGNRV